MLSLEVSCVKKNNHLKIASEHTILTRVSRLLAEWKIKTWKMKNCNPEVISVNPGLAKHALPFFLWLEVEIRNFYTNSGFAYSNNLTQNRQHWMVLSVKKQLGWDLQDKNSVLWGGFFFLCGCFCFTGSVRYVQWTVATSLHIVYMNVMLLVEWDPDPGGSW